MSLYFEELDYRPTLIGPISLRRRRELSLGVDVFEIMLGDEHLMSSLFTASEIALAELGLAALTGDKLDILVGGLGLGYTAKSVLEHDSVGSLLVVDMLEAVIDWHRAGLGVSLFSNDPTLAERYGLEALNGYMREETALQQRLWQGLAPAYRNDGQPNTPPEAPQQP